MIASILFYIMCGFVMGVIRGWNKKVYFIGFLVVAILWIIAASYTGLSNIESEIVWWKILINVLFLALGINIGESSYRETFK